MRDGGAHFQSTLTSPNSFFSSSSWEQHQRCQYRTMRKFLRAPILIPDTASQMRRMLPLRPFALPGESLSSSFPRGGCPAQPDRSISHVGTGHRTEMRSTPGVLYLSTHSHTRNAFGCYLVPDQIHHVEIRRNGQLGTMVREENNLEPCEVCSTGRDVSIGLLVTIASADSGQLC